MKARACLALFFATIVSAGANGKIHRQDRPKIVPQPRIIVPLHGVYRLPSTVTIAAQPGEARDAARFLAAYLNGIGLSAAVRDGRLNSPAVRLFSHTHDLRLGEEGYKIEVDDRGVRIDANDAHGLFYGVQTLEQLLPVGIDRPVHIPTYEIVDWPQYRWRGIHLDVSRHFFSSDVVKRYIDLAARFKLNVFHWHLTDDQAWRLSIRGYPSLTENGCRGGSEDCGYYSERDVRDIVTYARRRYVTVVPEIDMPAHSAALIRAYPSLGCEGTTAVLCPSKVTFRFVAAVLTDLARRFPASYVDVGGDEVPPGAWNGTPEAQVLCERRGFCTTAAIQGYFTRRVQALARRHGKRIVGWDEILDGRPDRDATIMAWRDLDQGAKAVHLGYQTIMSVQQALYFDAYQGSPDYEPVAFGGPSTLRDVYDFDPVPPSVSRNAASHILGVQANLWTERIPTAEHLFYMLLPRELALAEIAWTSPSQHNWLDFQDRLGAQLRRLDLERYPYRVPTVVYDVGDDPGVSPENSGVHNLATVKVHGGRVTVVLRDAASEASIRYTEGGALPTAQSRRYRRSLNVHLKAEGATALIGAIAVLPNGRTSAPAFVRLLRAEP